MAKQHDGSMGEVEKSKTVIVPWIMAILTVSALAFGAGREITNDTKQQLRDIKFLIENTNTKIENMIQKTNDKMDMNYDRLGQKIDRNNDRITKLESSVKP